MLDQKFRTIWSSNCLQRLGGISAGLYCLTILGVQDVFAADKSHDLHDTIEAAHGAADSAHGAEHASGGLPQFDPSSYSSQIFWLLITFAIMYFFFSKKTLPEISSVIENRKERVEGDLNSAKTLRDEAEDAQSTYEKLLEDSRNKATELLFKATEDVKSDADTQMDELRENSIKDIAALEKNIAKAKKQAMADMNDLVAEVASEAADKIVGIKADLKQAKTVVKTLNDREAA